MTVTAGSCASTPVAGTLVVGTISSMAVDIGTWHSGSSWDHDE